MPLRAMATELSDQFEIELARFAEMCDDRMIALERTQRAIREKRIGDIQLDPAGQADMAVQLGLVFSLAQSMRLAQAKAVQYSSPEIRAALV